MDNYHVTKKDDKWHLTKEGNSKPSKTAETKDQMIQVAREFMEDRGGSVKIHKQDGKIQEERTYPRSDLGIPKSRKVDFRNLTLETLFGDPSARKYLYIRQIQASKAEWFNLPRLHQ